MSVLSIKVPTRKKYGNLSYAPRIYREILDFGESDKNIKIIKLLHV